MMRHMRMLLFGLLGLVPIFLVGCRLAGTSSTHPVTTVPTTSASAKSTTPDLTQSVSRSDLMGDASDQAEPLNVARVLANSAGGSWVVLASKPLDDVPWDKVMEASYSDSGSNVTVDSMMEAIRKAGTPMAWDTSKGYLLLDFNSPSDLAHIRSQSADAAPEDFVGLYLRAETDAALFQAFGDVEHLQIKPDGTLLQQWVAFRAARLKNLKIDQSAPDLSNDERPPSLGGDDSDSLPKVAPEFKSIERLDLAGMMQHLGDHYGGEMVNTSGNQWELRPYTDPQKLTALIGRVKQPIDDASQTETTGFSSFESRHAGQSAESEGSTEITPPNAEVQSAFDTLGALGKPSVPTLVAYLSPDKPQTAMAAIKTLAAMEAPEAKQALATFADQLNSPTKSGGPAAAPASAGNATRAQLKAEVLRMVASDPGPASTKLLTEAALDDHSTPVARLTARLALLKTGDLSAIGTPSTTRTVALDKPNFILQNAPVTPPTSGSAPSTDPDPGSNVVTPLATATDAAGDQWAVFVSGRAGDPDDLWLAHGRGGTWTEFLFTGQQFARMQGYSSQGTPKSGACLLTVSGDKVVISPPKGDPAGQMTKLQKAMQDPKLTSAQRQKLGQQYETLSEKASNVLAKAFTFSCAALRKDSDGDGLTDLMETRLGTDPSKADTDGDGISDGQDANPLSSAVPTSDRAKILQSIFAGLYSGDKSTTPIVVVLPQPDFQEFYGAGGKVLCMTEDVYRHHYSHLLGLPLLEFTGPTDANDTILQQDGPCLFNDSHTKAEVHFFFMTGQSLQSAQESAQIYSSMMGGSSGGIGSDYVAHFESTGGVWTLKAMTPWKFETAGQAYTHTLQSAMSSMSGGYR